MSVETGKTTKLTYEDYLQFPDDGRRHEIIGGEHYVSPSPSAAHQDASRHIQFQLYRDIELRGLGRVYNAPMDLQLSEVDVVQPDLILILYEHRDRISSSRLLGAPDLVVEILSAATSKRDRSLKLKLYEGMGIGEYWVVDTDAHELTRYRLEGDAYGAPERFTEEIGYSAAPAGDRTEAVEATVDLRSVWRRLQA